MLVWILKNKFAISDSTEEITKNDKIRAVLSTSKVKNKITKNSIEVREFNLNKISLFKTRELILNAQFFEKIGFPFVIYSVDNIAKSSLLAVIYLICRDKDEKNAIALIEKKTGLKFKALDKEFVKSTAKNVELFALNETLDAFFTINELIKILRHQCPWDREQTHSSLIPEIIEEPLELVEEINRSNSEGIKEELGDVLLQILLHSIISEEEKKFNIVDVIDKLYEKMYERHPHVFGKSKVKESKEVLEQWEDIKKRKNGDKTLNIAKILASFITTVDVQEAARKEGLDFISVEQIEKKISEELKELKEARELGEGVSIEVGDLLFSVINLARFLEIDPAHALFLSMDKFSERFKSLKKKGGNLTSISNNKKDKMWEEIKKNERFQ